MKNILIFCLIISALSIKAQNNLESDTIDILHYNINLDLKHLSNQELKGNTELLITSKINNVNRLKLDLLSLNIDSIFVDNQKITNYNYNDTLIYIPLNNQISIGDTITAQVFYRGSPVIDQSGWGGFYFSNDSSYAFNLGVGMQADPHNYGRVWYPCIDDFIDKATYSFAIDVKNSNVAVCNGSLDSVINNSTFKTFYWSLDTEISSYLSSIAVGNYHNYADMYNSVNGNIPINIYAKPNDSADIAGTFVHLKDMLDAYENAFGPYVWERVGYVGVPFSSGAMEHATNIALGFVYMNGATTYEDLIAHELSHHWFGDLVTCSSAEDMWLNEGWAVYSESVFREYLYGKENYRNNIRNLLYHVIRNAHKTDGAYYPVSGIPHNVTYGTTVYDKGGTVAHTIRGYMGDSLFFPAIQAFLDSFAYQSVSSEEFRDFLTYHSGINMNDFFDSWVFEPGFVNFSLDSFNVISSASPEFDVEVSIKQKLHHKPNFANSNRIPIRFIDDNWNTFDAVFEFSGESGTNTFSVPFAPTQVLIDPDGKIADATIDYYDIYNNTTTVQYSAAACDIIINSIQDSALIYTTHNWAAPDTFGTNIQGLKISNNRFWTIQGIIPQGTQAKAKFYYSKSNYNDDILNSANDSIVLLYREDAGEKWCGVNFTQTGVWLAGNLQTNQLKTGQYAIGVWDAAYVGIQNKNQKNSIIVSPNPSNGLINITTKNTKISVVNVYDINSKLVFTENISGKFHRNIDLSNLNSGTYFLEVISNENYRYNHKIIIE